MQKLVTIYLSNSVYDKGTLKRIKAGEGLVEEHLGTYLADGGAITSPRVGNAFQVRLADLA